MAPLGLELHSSAGPRPLRESRRTHLHILLPLHALLFLLPVPTSALTCPSEDRTTFSSVKLDVSKPASLIGGNLQPPRRATVSGYKACAALAQKLACAGISEDTTGFFIYATRGFSPASISNTSARYNCIVGSACGTLNPGPVRATLGYSNPEICPSDADAGQTIPCPSPSDGVTSVSVDAAYWVTVGAYLDQGARGNAYVASALECQQAARNAGSRFYIYSKTGGYRDSGVINGNCVFGSACKFLVSGRDPVAVGYVQ